MKIQQNGLYFLYDLFRNSTADSFRKIDEINHHADEVFHTTDDSFLYAEDISCYTDEMIHLAEEFFRRTDDPFRGRNTSSVLRNKASVLRKIASARSSEWSVSRKYSPWLLYQYPEWRNESFIEFLNASILSNGFRM